MPEQKLRLKATFKVKEGDKEVEYAVRRPTPKELAEGQKVYNKAFREAVEADAIVRPKLDALLKRQNLWDDEKTAQHERLNASILENEMLLSRKYKEEAGSDGKTKVKVPIKMSEARQIAIQLMNLRYELANLLSVRNQLDGMTAEAQADNARFNSYMHKCLVYNEGELAGTPVYKTLDEYLEKGGEERAILGAGHLMSLIISGSDPDWQKKLPENRFLLKYGFVDDKLRLINKDGHLIDQEGRLINEDGRYVNEQGELVNRDGQKVSENGEPIYDDGCEFEDDMGVTQPKEENETPAEENNSEETPPEENP
jgi:hypothetical protein